MDSKCKIKSVLNDAGRWVGPVLTLCSFNRVLRATIMPCLLIINHQVSAQQFEPVLCTKDGDVSLTNKIYMIQGVDFSTSAEIADEERLLEESSYFLQLYYHLPVTTNLTGLGFSMGFSADFRQNYLGTTNVSVGAVSAEDVTKADTIGINISPKFSYSWEKISIFIRPDIGGVMAQSNEENVDEEFHSALDVVCGVEAYDENKRDHFRFEVGGAYHERLPKDQGRAIARFIYGREISQGKIMVSLELNGFDHSDNEETRVQAAYVTDPTVLLTSVKDIFTAPK